ncbi:MAG: TIM barrel protein [Albidovulum sp.]|nr:TIM barrel protein [Albidovulum sp.]
MKLGVICDGISRDLDHALTVMDEYELEFAELQFVWDKEIGDHTPMETKRIKNLLDDHQKKVCCLSRHIFAGTTTSTKPHDELHSKHMDYLKRVIDSAHLLKSPLVRIMNPKKETIIWGENGAEVWNVANGAWDVTLELILPAVELARTENITLAVETGNGTMVNSNYMAKRLIDELNAKDVLKVLWDPANCLWCHEVAYPDAYYEVHEGYLGHIHIKDVEVNTPRSTLKVKEFGEGQLGRLFKPISIALQRDSYAGTVSFESVYHPGNGDFEAGFRKCIEKFKSVFGGGAALAAA